ncbi:O-methyltransferase [Amycolatopsis japonica]
MTSAQGLLIAATLELRDVAEMRTPAERGTLLSLLTRLTSARTVVEVGTFTGYSTRALAEGVGPGGHVITCDSTDEWARTAAKEWRKAGVAARIEPMYGPAAETLCEFPEIPLFDLAFIDAARVNYIDYWEALVPRIRSGGLLIADNGLLPDGEGLNAYMLADDRVESVLLTAAGGVTLARKKSALNQEVGR